MGQAQILTVCSGNICRSPLAAALLRAHLSDLPVSITSAGVIASNGHPMTTQTLAQAKLAGLTPPEHQSRFLTEPILEQTDLVLVMAAHHRHEVVKLLPRMKRLTYLITEFGPLADTQPASAPLNSDPAQTLRTFAKQLATATSGTASQPPDVVDPYGRDEAAYQHMRQQLEPAATSAARVIRRVLSNGQ